jgi:hypothetical protein
MIDISLLTSNSWFTFFLSIITILSFIGMFYFYYKSKKDKLPCYCILSTNILKDLSGNFKPLKVLYNEVEIKNLTVTRISFWNSGKETIRKTDIADEDPLTIKTINECKILDIKMLKPNNGTNGFKYMPSNDLSSFTFTFNYIDQYQGALFQLLHSGTSTTDIKFTGSIIGYGKPKFVCSSNLSPKTNLHPYFSKIIKNYKIISFINTIYLLFFVAFFLFAGLGFTLFPFYVLFFDDATKNFPSSIFMVVISVVIGLFGIFLLIMGIVYFKEWRVSLSVQIPQDFDLFGDVKTKK